MEEERKNGGKKEKIKKIIGFENNEKNFIFLNISEKASTIRLILFYLFILMA